MLPVSGSPLRLAGILQKGKKIVNVNMQAPQHEDGTPDSAQSERSEEVPGEGRFNVYDAPASVWPDFLQGQAERPVRVLLVDSDVHMRRVIAQELMSDARTMLVAQAANLREGRRAIKAHAFDVMLVDLQLGDGQGLDLIDYMKAVRPEAEAVVVTASDNDDNAWRAFERGATGYLVKNSWFDNYVQAVLQVTNGGAPITPRLARRLLQRFEPAQSLNPDTLPFAPPPPAVAIDGPEKLSDREKEVLRMVASGHTNAEIAAHLAITPMTVNTHIRNIYRKLQVRTRAQAVRFASLRNLF